jgi:hypothetical protein
MGPDPSQWRSSTSYDYFDDLRISDLAWECLRRNADYQRDYAKTLHETVDPEQATTSFRLRWGLQFRCRSESQRRRRAGPLDYDGRSWKDPADHSASPWLTCSASAGA